MIVHPDFLDHPKTSQLCALAGDKFAPVVWVLRLWGYCQRQRAFEFKNISGAALAVICRAEIDGNKLLTLLQQVGFIRIDGERLIVHDWEFHNRMLVSAWANGRKGGYPPDFSQSGSQSARRTASQSGSPSTRAGDRTDQNRAGLPVGSEKEKERKRRPSLQLIDQPINPAREHAYDLTKVRPVPIEERKFKGQLKKLADSLKANYSTDNGDAESSREKP